VKANVENITAATTLGRRRIRFLAIILFICLSACVPDGTVRVFGRPPPPVTPPNDYFSNSIPISGGGSGFNNYATLEPGEPNPGDGIVPATNTVWWNWTAPTNGPASVQTYGSGFDTIIDVYTGSVVSNLVCVTSNLNTVLDYELYNQNPNNGVYTPVNAGLTNCLGFTAHAGTNYYFQISGLTNGTINIAVQPVALKVLSVNELATNNTDQSVNFNAQVQIGNSGSFAPGPLRLEVLARAGYSAASNVLLFTDNTVSPAYIPGDQVLTNYYLVNPATVVPGSSTNITFSAICPGPIYTNILPAVPQDANTVGFGWGIYAILQEEVGTNWFFKDNELLFYGQWPSVGGGVGPTSGVIRVNPSVSGFSLSPVGGTIIGPSTVNENSTTNYSGVVYFPNGNETATNFVTFTNTSWTASGFTIRTNGSFAAGTVITNTPVTLTAYYSYVPYTIPVTTSVQVAITVLKSPIPSLSDVNFHTNKVFSLALNALPGSTFVIQTATNLPNAQWIPLATNVTDTNGVWFFTDTKDTNRNRMFFRALETP
jgi:hypothetical protein